MKTELVFIPLPATGHLVSTVLLAKLLVGRDDRLSIQILLFNLPFDPEASAYMNSLQSEPTTGIQYVQLSDPEPETQTKTNSPAIKNPFMLTSSLLEKLKPQVRTVVSRLKPSGIVVDMFCTSMIDVANEFEVPAYVFYTSGAAMIGLRRDLQILLDEDTNMAGCRELSASTFFNPVPTKLLPSMTVDKNSPIVQHTRRIIYDSRGIMVNTFSELESYAVEALNSIPKMPRIYPVGPLVSLKGTRNESDFENTLKWLDEQPVSSVIFLCFGSMGSFDAAQVKEIAHAIEHSRNRFLWSLRKPPRKEERMGFPTEYEDYEQVLPEGFLGRTSELGKVIGWAPQAQVLGHPAVGGFVTHCGWNSVLESVWFGVPMAVWPLYAEQQLNALSLVKEVGIAVEIKMDYRKDAPVLVGADQIEGGIREVMQAESGIRKKVMELMEKARNASLEGGSSYISLGRFIEDIRD